MKAYKTLLKAAAVCTLPFMALGAQAGDSGDYGLKSWAKEAGTAVNDAMGARSLLARTSTGAGLAIYQVTIDRDGEIVDADRIRKPNDMAIRSAANRVLKNVNFPDLPASYNQEKLTFVLQLTYATSEAQAERFHHEGYVTSRQVAANTDSIRIVAQNLR